MILWFGCSLFLDIYNNTDLIWGETPHKTVITDISWQLAGALIHTYIIVVKRVAVEERMDNDRVVSATRWPGSWSNWTRRHGREQMPSPSSRSANHGPWRHQRITIPQFWNEFQMMNCELLLRTTQKSLGQGVKRGRNSGFSSAYYCGLL